MIKAAIEKIVEMCVPHIVEPACGEVVYSDKKLFPVAMENTAAPINTGTLDSIVEYVKEYAVSDSIEVDRLLIHVVDYRTVMLMNCLNMDKQREVLMVAKADVPQFPFSRFMDNEEFTIAVQSMFQDIVVPDDGADDKELVLKFSGTVTAGSVSQYKDDGVTQKATIKKGVASKTEAVVPSPCRLRPYRTFVEVVQPMSEFIFRMREGGNNTVESALFVADGGAWKITAMKTIKQYLEERLEGTGVTIIS